MYSIPIINCIVNIQLQVYLSIDDMYGINIVIINIDVSKSLYSHYEIDIQ